MAAERVQMHYFTPAALSEWCVMGGLWKPPRNAHHDLKQFHFSPHNDV